MIMVTILGVVSLVIAVLSCQLWYKALVKGLGHCWRAITLSSDFWPRWKIQIYRPDIRITLTSGHIKSDRILGTRYEALISSRNETITFDQIVLWTKPYWHHEPDKCGNYFYMDTSCSPYCTGVLETKATTLKYKRPLTTPVTVEADGCQVVSLAIPYETNVFDEDFTWAALHLTRNKVIYCRVFHNK